MLKPSEQTKTTCFFFIRTKISTLIDNIEHEISLTTSIYMAKVTKIAVSYTHLTLPTTPYV